jgi:type VI secretion system secreted protein VgrG
MPQDYQINRVFRVATDAFEAGTLLFGSMRAQERLSQPFEIELALFSEEAVDAEKILGEALVVTIVPDPDAAPVRYFHGLVTDFEHVGWNDRLNEYRATVRPWLWFLTRTADCRVFQNKTVPEIVDKVCELAGFRDLRLELNGTHDPREYCVQFRETDFNFVSRLLEQEGIFYFFEHSQSKHELVLCDDVAKLTSVPGYDNVPFWIRPASGASGERDNLTSWTVRQSFQSGKFATREFDFKTPTPVLEGTSTITRGYKTRDPGEFEMFDFPALAATQTSAAVGEVAKIRVQELQTAQMVARGKGDALGLATGRIFSLTHHPRLAFNQMSYLVRSTIIDMRNNSYFAGGGSGPTDFEIQIEALDASEPYRAPRTTPKPLVHGLQTALVVGPEGTEIYTDELGFGRVKVRFHWDRQETPDENRSCWMRVGQTWAGKNWGAVQIPRVGQEVIVSFLDGDPDRPVIIGSLYNGSNKPPYPLPANNTQSGVKSRSSPDGTSGNFNEIRFEDEKGKEHLYIQAEKDHQVEVKNDMTVHVENDMTVKVDRSLTLTTGLASIKLTSEGTVEISGKLVTIKAAADLNIEATGALNINATGDLEVNGKGMIGIDATGLLKIGAQGLLTVTGMGPVNITGVGGVMTGVEVIPPPPV